MWYEDETSEEYEDGDNNETYHEAMRAYRWMNGEDDRAPSASEK